MNIEIFGEGERQKSAEKLISREKINFDCVKLLPIPSSKDGEYITGTGMRFNDFIAKVKESDFVIGYGLSPGLCEMIEAKGALCYDAASDEEFLVENAYITALGTLGYILTTAKRIPSDMKFGIVGYGRIGSSLARLLLFLGASVKIFSSKKLTRIELGCLGIETPDVELADFKRENISGLDFLLNTAPTDLSYFFPEKCVPPSLRVIDLASGDSFPDVLGVEYLPSLPNRMYPETAGAVYARRALLWLRNREK